MTSNEDIQVTSDKESAKDTLNKTFHRTEPEDEASGTNWKSFLNVEPDTSRTGQNQLLQDQHNKITDNINKSPETGKVEQHDKKQLEGVPEQSKPIEGVVKPEEKNVLAVEAKPEQEKPGVGKPEEGQEKLNQRKTEEHHETTDVKSDDGKKKRKGRSKKGNVFTEEDTEQIAEHTRKHRSVDPKEFEKYESLLNKKTTRKRKTK
jgi:hypothetical protein